MDIGVNFSGAEYSSGGSNGTAKYVFPTNNEIDYFADHGATNIRLALSWEALQPQLYGSLSSDYVNQIKAVVAYAASRGVKVILDLHNYGSYNGKLIGSPQTPTSAFADLWGKLATQFSKSSNVMFGLMNEPQVATAGDWLTSVNAAIAAIRNVGATSQQILVSGIGWDGGSTWTTNGNAAVLGAPGAIKDSAHNFAFEVHQYLDDGSGQSGDVVSTTIGVERLQAITSWAKASGAKLFLGEFGVSNQPKALAALDNMLNYMQQNSDVWQGGSVWAAGQNWQNYMFSVEPELGLLDQPQMAVLDKYTNARQVSTDVAGGGKRVDTYVEGRSSPSITDVFDAGGHLLSRALFTAAGNLDRTLSMNPDGSLTVSVYDGEGHSTPTSIDVYNGSHALLSKTTFNADGGKTVEVHADGANDATSFLTYGRDGTLLSKVVNGSDGFHRGYQAVASGSVTQTFNSLWQLVAQSDYDTTGRLVSSSAITAAGHNVKSQYDAMGRVTTASDYDASGSLVSMTSVDAASNVSNVQTWQADGSRKIDSFNLGSAQPFMTRQYDLSGNLLSTAVANSDGSHSLTTYAAPGQSLAAKTSVFDASWHLLTQTTVDATGRVTQVRTETATGSHIIKDYAVGGSATPSTVTTYDASWTVVETDHLDATGAITAIDHAGPNGGHVVDHFAAGNMAHPASTDVYDAGWHMLSRTTFDATGLVTQVRTDQGNGAHVVASYAIAGSATPSTIATYDASWGLVEMDSLNTQGATTSIDRIGSNGDHTVDQLADGNTGHVVSRQVYDANWHLRSRTNYDAKGLVTTVQTEASNGSHVMASYAVAGSATPSSVSTYDASWARVETDRFDSSGALTSIDRAGADGSHAVDQFDKNKTQPIATTVYDTSWHTLSTSTFNAGGQVTQMTVTAAATGKQAAVLSAVSLDDSGVVRDLGTVTQIGTVTLGSSAVATARIELESGATWQVAGDVDLRTQGSLATIGLSGTLIKTAGSAGQSLVSPNVTGMGAGTVEVASGKLELGGVLSGTLALSIDAGTTLILDKAAAAGTAVSFKGSGAAMQLNDAADFHGAISGFGAGNSIDLRSVAYNPLTGPSLQYVAGKTGGLLTVSDGAHTASLAMVGLYSGSGFIVGSDGHDGSLITLRPS